MAWSSVCKSMAAMVVLGMMKMMNLWCCLLLLK